MIRSEKKGKTKSRHVKRKKGGLRRQHSEGGSQLKDEGKRPNPSGDRKREKTIIFIRGKKDQKKRRAEE